MPALGTKYFVNAFKYESQNENSHPQVYPRCTESFNFRTTPSLTANQRRSKRMKADSNDGVLNTHCAMQRARKALLKLSAAAAREIVGNPKAKKPDTVGSDCEFVYGGTVHRGVVISIEKKTKNTFYCIKHLRDRVYVVREHVFSV